MFCSLIDSDARVGATCCKHVLWFQCVLKCLVSCSVSCLYWCSTALGTHCEPHCKRSFKRTIQQKDDLLHFVTSTNSCNRSNTNKDYSIQILAVRWVVSCLSLQPTLVPPHTALLAPFPALSPTSHDATRFVNTVPNSDTQRTIVVQTNALARNANWRRLSLFVDVFTAASACFLGL